MNHTESLLHALKDHGASQIFGIPGDFALPYFQIFVRLAQAKSPVFMAGVEVRAPN